MVLPYGEDDDEDKNDHPEEVKIASIVIIEPNITAGQTDEVPLSNEHKYVAWDFTDYSSGVYADGQEQIQARVDAYTDRIRRNRKRNRIRRVHHYRRIRKLGLQSRQKDQSFSTQLTGRIARMSAIAVDTVNMVYSRRKQQRYQDMYQHIYPYYYFQTAPTLSRWYRHRVASRRTRHFLNVQVHQNESWTRRKHWRLDRVNGEDILVIWPRKLKKVKKTRLRQQNQPSAPPKQQNSQQQRQQNNDNEYIPLTRRSLDMHELGGIVDFDGDTGVATTHFSGGLDPVLWQSMVSYEKSPFLSLPLVTVTVFIWSSSHMVVVPTSLLFLFVPPERPPEYTLSILV